MLRTVGPRRRALYAVASYFVDMSDTSAVLGFMVRSLLFPKAHAFRIVFWFGCICKHLHLHNFHRCELLRSSQRVVLGTHFAGNSS